MKNYCIKMEKVKVLLAYALAFVLIFSCFIGVLPSGRFATADTTDKFIITKNANGSSYDVNYSSESIASGVTLNAAITAINSKVAEQSGSESNIQLGDGAVALDIGTETLTLSNGTYNLSGKLTSSSSSQAVLVGSGATVTTTADITSDGNGITNSGVLNITGGTISAQKSAVANKKGMNMFSGGKVSISGGTLGSKTTAAAVVDNETQHVQDAVSVSGSPTFVIPSGGVVILTETNAITDKGYTGTAVISLNLKSFSGIKDEDTPIIVHKSIEKPLLDLKQWSVFTSTLNNHFELQVYNKDGDNYSGSLIARKYYTISYLFVKPMTFLNGYQPTYKAFPGENILLPTKSEVSIVGDASTVTALEGWHIDSPSEDGVYSGDTITEIANIRKDWTVYAKFNQPFVPGPWVPPATPDPIPPVVPDPPVDPDPNPPVEPEPPSGGGSTGGGGSSGGGGGGGSSKPKPTPTPTPEPSPVIPEITVDVENLPTHSDAFKDDVKNKMVFGSFRMSRMGDVSSAQEFSVEFDIPSGIELQEGEFLQVMFYEKGQLVTKTVENKNGKGVFTAKEEGEFVLVKSGEVKNNSSTTTIIIIAVSAVVLLGGGAAAFMIIRKKRKI